ncbi:peptidoglycan-binding protein [Streptomyces sp. NPDC101132]|uniref:peptidoglycan-binding domain-containing protein n=1 Tax=Streptomyces sp. NPDC101132 TaxID=3366110 RepID=UPI00382C28DE
MDPLRIRPYVTMQDRPSRDAATTPPPRLLGVVQPPPSWPAGADPEPEPTWGPSSTPGTGPDPAWGPSAGAEAGPSWESPGTPDASPAWPSSAATPATGPSWSPSPNPETGATWTRSANPENGATWTPPTHPENGGDWNSSARPADEASPWPPQPAPPGTPAHPSGPDAHHAGGPVGYGPDGFHATDEAGPHDGADGYATQVLPPVSSGMPGSAPYAPVPGANGSTGPESSYGTRGSGTPGPVYDDATTELRAVTLGAPPPPGRNRGGRKGLPLMVAAAVAVIGVGALTAGLFSDDEDADRALPDPKLSAPAITVAPDGPSGAPEAPSADPSTTSDADEDEDEDGDGNEKSASPTAATEATPSGDPSDASGNPTPDPTRTKPATSPTTPSATTAPTLSQGDQGPEVVELQQRLEEGGYYWGPMNGRYSRKVEEAVARLQRAANVVGDPWGVYGPNSRRALEALTHEP